MNRRYIFIIISFIALLAVLVIQVNWILKSAALKEELFNEKAKIVLSKASEAIVNDKATCRKIGESLEEDDEAQSNQSQFQVIDSLFNHYLEFYKIDMNYSYEFVSPQDSVTNETFDPQNAFKQNIEEGSFPKSFQLKLIFPDKNQFIFAEMGFLFFASVGLIAIIFIFFLLAIRSLLLEKQIAERTTEFVNNMTHEFKTPLTNIGLAAKILRTKSDEKGKRYTDIIQFEKNKLGLQVEQVLNMASIESPNLSLNILPIDFHKLIQKAAQIMNLQLQDQNGNLTLELNATNCTISGDETHLLNSICNLIDNAVKYNSSPPEIHITTKTEEDSIFCTVSDNGIGIDKKNQERIFEKYYRIERGNIHTVKGFGIGLAYVRKIIELHGGTITLNSIKDKGSKFKIRIPYEK